MDVNILNFKNKEIHTLTVQAVLISITTCDTYTLLIQTIKAKL